MEIRVLDQSSKNLYESKCIHPLQSWYWGDFRESMGQEVVRLGVFNADELVQGYQILIYEYALNVKFGYSPRCNKPTRELLSFLTDFAKKNKLSFIRFEPNVHIVASFENVGVKNQIQKSLLDLGLRNAPPIQHSYTIRINLEKSNEQLISGLKRETKHNIKQGKRNGITVAEDNSAKSFASFEQLVELTTKRQGFLAHDTRYRQTLWKSMSNANISKIFNAVYKNKIVASWMVLDYKDQVYYLMGGSLRKQELNKVKASNVLAWEIISHFKSLGYKAFDFWGTLPEKHSPNNSWAGFTRFKLGYGGDIYQYPGAFDHVYVASIKYNLLKLLYAIREAYKVALIKIVRFM